MSPTSTDSGISNDIENKTAVCKNKIKVSTSNHKLIGCNANNVEITDKADQSRKSLTDIQPKSSSFFPNILKNEQKILNSKSIFDPNAKDNYFFSKALPSVFSPRPSPVTSPTQLPPLKEELKIVEEGMLSAAFHQTNVPPSKYQNFLPDATVFTFQNQTNKNDVKLKRKRKSVQRSRGPRPKTAAIAATKPCGSGVVLNSTNNGQKFDFTEQETNVNQPYYQQKNKTNQSSMPVTVNNYNRFSNTKPLNNNSDLEVTKKVKNPKENVFQPDKPPLFLSQINKRPSVRFSIPEKNSPNQVTQQLKNEVSSRFSSNAEKLEQLPLSNLYSREDRIFPRNTTFSSPINNSVPVHSIEEAFESRIPQGFTIQQRRRLSPLTNRKDRSQKTSSGNF